MPSQQRARAVVLALVVVFAGCGGSSVPEPAADSSWGPVYGDEDLSFDPDTVYERVAEMHGTNVSELPNVQLHLENASDRWYDRRTPTDFEYMLGVDGRMPDTTIVGSAGERDVYLVVDEVTEPGERERVLAHEFAHVVQQDVDASERVNRRLDPAVGNSWLLERAVIEGAARYVETRYVERYLNGSDGSTWRDVRGGRTIYGALQVAPYHFGAAYVERRVDSPADLDEIYDNPPRTTEQLLHGYAPDEELPVELQVGLNSTDLTIMDRRVKGELFVRVLLEGELGLDRAADAAAGWGNDEVLALGSHGTAGNSYAWVLRWDSPRDADEFQAAIEDYLHERANATDGIWRDPAGNAFSVVRTTDDTVVVIAGAPSFVRATTATGEGGEVTIHVDELNEGRALGLIRSL